jgi:hypothetical protein
VAIRKPLTLAHGPFSVARTVTRWLVLDIALPIFFRPLRPLVTRSFDKENVRTMAALKAYAEANR